MTTWCTEHPDVESLNVVVVGCVVNDPGESKLADIGISLPGTGETLVVPIYVDGERRVTLKSDNIAVELLQIVEDYIKANYCKGGAKRKQNRVIPIQSA